MSRIGWLATACIAFSWVAGCDATDIEAEGDAAVADKATVDDMSAGDDMASVDGMAPGAALDRSVDPEPDSMPDPEPDSMPEPEPDMAPEPEPDMAPDPEPDMALDPEPDMAPDPEPDMAPPGEPHPCGDAFPLTIADLDFPDAVVLGSPRFEASMAYTGDPRRARDRLIVAVRYAVPGSEVTTFSFQTDVGDDCVIRFQFRPGDPDEPGGQTEGVFRVLDRPEPPPFPDWDPPASNDLLHGLRVVAPGGR